MLCKKYMEGRSGNRCGLSRNNRLHTVPSAVGYHEFIESSEVEPSTVATFGDELKAFAAKLSDKLRDRAWDISSERGESDTTAALNILADEIDEVLHEGPNG